MHNGMIFSEDEGRLSDGKTIIIAGAGPSVHGFKWPDFPIMAISGGYRHAPRINYFVTLDKAHYFPNWLADSAHIAKHVPAGWNPEWSEHPNCTEWEYIHSDDPAFESGGLASANVHSDSRPNQVWHYSLLFAVQVAARLGFTRCIFIGVDLLGGLERFSDQLRAWYPKALALGIEWVNHSPLSTLCKWMPNSFGSLCGAASASGAPLRFDQAGGVASL